MTKTININNEQYMIELNNIFQNQNNNNEIVKKLIYRFKELFELKNKSNPDNKTKRLLCTIGTPAYNSLLTTDYFHSIHGLSTIIYSLNLPIDLAVITIGNESLISRARNKLFSIAKNLDSDWLFFIDADIGIQPLHILKILSYNFPFIGIPVRLKDPFKKEYNYSLTKESNNIESYLCNNIIKVDRVGTALMCINKELINDVVEYCKTNKLYYYNNQRFSRSSQLSNISSEISEIIYDAFPVYTQNNYYYSEDYGFCEIVKKLGYNLLVDLSINNIHYGSVPIIYNHVDNNDLIKVSNKDYKQRSKNKFKNNILNLYPINE